MPVTYLPRVWMGTNISPKLLPSRIQPLSAHIKLTENCQAKCISCDYWKTRWADVITTERAVDLLNQIYDCGIEVLRLTGGEPLLRKDLFEILDKANASRFKRVILQTNGLALKKLHKELNASAITDVAVSIDGLKESNDIIRGIRGYFDLGMEGLALMKGKRLSISVTLNKMSTNELDELSKDAEEAGAHLQFNILSTSLSFLENADLNAMWPDRGQVRQIKRFLDGRRPQYEVDYITRYYNRENLPEPACVLGYLQVFVMSNGDVLTGCYPLPRVGNILHEKLATVLHSEAYRKQAEAMLRRECPSCTCGVESSLAMKHGIASGFFELSRLKKKKNNGDGSDFPAAGAGSQIPEPV